MNTSIEIESSKKLRSAVPSRMRREIDIHVSCDEVLKVKPKTIIYTRVQGGNEENFDSSYGAAPTQDEVAFSAHATIRDEIPVAGGAYKLIDENDRLLPYVSYIWCGVNVTIHPSQSARLHLKLCITKTPAIRLIP
nr:uncharacterized protein LOC109175453 [Ipomoea batatas]